MIEIDTLVVGAGPHALTVVSRWVCDRPATVDHLLAVDPAGCWMHAWDRQFDQQRIDVLRSPGVHHPDPDEMALLHANDYNNRPTDRSGEPLRGALRRPTTSVFARFCRDLAARTGLSQRVLPATVVDLQPAANGPTSGWAATLGDGSTVQARRVVWAGNPRVPTVPHAVHRCEAIVHSAEVDVTTVTAGQRLAVLGGGQTAGQLALVAARAGADVVLVSRGPQRIVNLDVDAGWLMDDHLVPFRSIADPRERRHVVERVRRGSMTADLAKSLADASVRWFSDAGDLSAWPDGDGAVVGFGGAEVRVDRVWVATGSCPDVRAEPVLARRAADGAPHVDGWPILDDRLHWEDGLVILGALAALTLGPAAGNLGGARAAAELLAPQAPATETDLDLDPSGQDVASDGVERR
ncbi:MAG: FAD-dependent oxidoreductase [Actinomycetota bacterium]